VLQAANTAITGATANNLLGTTAAASGSVTATHAHPPLRPQFFHR